MPFPIVVRRPRALLLRLWLCAALLPAAALHASDVLAVDHAKRTAMPGPGERDLDGTAGAHELRPRVDPVAVVESTPALGAEALIRKVLQRNPGIAAMRAAADAAGAKIESAGALDDPMVSYLVAPNTAGGPGQGLNQNIQVSQAIPWPGTLDLRIRAARADAQSAERQADDVRLRLAAVTRGVYAEWYYVHRALAVNAENRVLVKRLEPVAETAYASGQAPQQDVLQAQVELVRLQNQRLELERRRRVVMAKINTLLNQPPDTALAAPEDLPATRALPDYTLLQTAALAGYPMLQSLGARVDASRDRVALARKNNYPEFKLMAGYNSIMDLPAKRLTLGVAINIPFGGNHRGAVGEARARAHEAEARLADARAQLLGELDQSWAAAAQAIDTIKLDSRKLLPLSKLNFQAAEADYRGGNGDFLKLITAQQQYLAAKLELARARADLYTQLASLDYQTSGAVWPASASATTLEATP
ncbi:MAG: TolC family protein [Rudaea sp.]